MKTHDIFSHFTLIPLLLKKHCQNNI